MRETDEYLIERYQFAFQRELYRLSETLSDKTLLWCIFASFPFLLPYAAIAVLARTENVAAALSGTILSIVLMILMTEPIMEAKRWI